MLTSFLSWLGSAGSLLAFAVAALLSLAIATFWGELAAIRPHRDKSGLGGFAAIYVFCGLRWLLLAPLVVSGAHAMLPGCAWYWLLGHLLLGIFSMWLFERGLRIVRQDRVVPLWLGFTGAVLLPGPAAWLGSEVVALPTFASPRIVTGLLLSLQAFAFWRRRRELFRPDPPPAPSEVVDTDRGGR